MPEVTGDAALLVGPDDAAALAGELRRVLNDDALARDLSRRGLERAVQFSWQRCARETLAVYEGTGSQRRFCCIGQNTVRAAPFPAYPC